jgi:hypothetical protein
VARRFIENEIEPEAKEWHAASSWESLHARPISSASG